MPIYSKYLQKARSISERPANRNLLVCLIFCAAPLMAHEDVQDQIAQLTGQIAKSPKNAELYLRRGELHRVRNNRDAAMADYDRAERLDPELNAVKLCKGKLYLDSGQPEKAKTALDQFLSLQPNHATALASRGRALVLLEQRAAAAEDFSRAIEIDPQPEYYMDRARALAAEGSLSEALAGLDEGIERIGNLVTLQLLAIDLELSRKDYQRALTRLDTIITQSERKEKWLAQRGDIQQQAGLIDEARKSYTQALMAIETLPNHLRTSRSVLELKETIAAKLNTLPK